MNVTYIGLILLCCFLSRENQTTSNLGTNIYSYQKPWHDIQVDSRNLLSMVSDFWNLNCICINSTKKGDSTAVFTSRPNWTRSRSKTTKLRLVKSGLDYPGEAKDSLKHIWRFVKPLFIFKNALLHFISDSCENLLLSSE